MRPPTDMQPKMTGTALPHRDLPALTGLRALAAYLVFLHHANPAPTGSFAHRLFDQGYLGVSIFFVLSGFLIYHRYADVFLEQKSWSWRIYLQNRFARIYPLYALILLVTVGHAFYVGRPPSAPVLFLNLSLLKGFFNVYKFSGIPQSWSLTVEVCFYALAPLLFRLLHRLGTLRLTAGLLGMGLILWATVGQLAGHGFFGNLPFVLFYTFFGRSFEFVLGMHLARRWQSKQLSGFRLSSLWGGLTVLACVLWQASVVVLTRDQIHLIWSEVVAYNFFLPIGISFVLGGLLDQKSVWRSTLAIPLLLALGRSSYAFYLIHVGVIATACRNLGINHTGFLFGVLVLIAYGLYQFIEKPTHRWLRAS
ncbi:acyltransferase family protein [Spirosoma koreense]